MKLLAIVVVVLAFNAVSAQNFHLNCHFQRVNLNYGCYINTTTVPDNQNLNFIIGGNHLDGFSDDDVREVVIQKSSIPFIVTQFFTQFTSLKYFRMLNSGLTRVQSGAFNNANSLTHIQIEQTSQFRTIEANAFSGARTLFNVDLQQNNIEWIHESAFEGVTTVSNLDFSNNQIKALSHKLFIQMSPLFIVDFSNNQLETLDGKLFADSPGIYYMDFSNNKLNAIGENFLDNMVDLYVVAFRGNYCVDFTWIINRSVTVESVRRGLQTCFENFV
jgi:hypothetical protein